MKIPQYPTKTPQENASKIMTILEKYALSPASTRQKAQKYLQEKQAREERKILVDGVYRDPDDLDGSKEAAAARREQRKRTAWLIARGTDPSLRCSDVRSDGKGDQSAGQPEDTVAVRVSVPVLMKREDGKSYKRV